VAEAEVALPALGGRVRLSRSPAHLAVGLELQADAPATVRLSGAAGTLRSVGVVRAAGEVAARWSGEALVLEFTGPCRCVCFFTPADAAAATGVRLSASAGNREWSTTLAP